MNTKEYNIAVRQWGPHLLRFAKNNLRNIDLAKDIVQDAFETLWNKKHEIELIKAKQFLFTVVYRKGIDLFRNTKHETQFDEYNIEQHNTSSIEKNYSEKELIHLAINQLSETHKQLILLRDLEGYDYNSITKITGLSVSQVKVNLFRARKSLKESIIKLESI